LAHCIGPSLTRRSIYRSWFFFLSFSFSFSFSFTSRQQTQQWDVANNVQKQARSKEEGGEATGMLKKREKKKRK
jgi:hypothetical protein